MALQDQFVEEFRALETTLPSEAVILFADGVHPQHNTEASYACGLLKGKRKRFYPIQLGYELILMRLSIHINEQK